MSRILENLVRALVAFILTFFLIVFVIEFIRSIQSITTFEGATVWSLLGIINLRLITAFNSYDSMLKWLILGFAGLTGLMGLLYVSLPDASGRERRRWFKNKYERLNYTKLISTRKRKRGTVRIMYNSEGNITRENRIEIPWDNVKAPFVKTYNKILSYFYLPDVKKLFDGKKQYQVGENLQYHTSGIPIKAYRKFYLWGKFNKVFLLTTGVHNAFIGSTGRGKSETFVLPLMYSIIDAGKSMVVHDPKHELYLKTATKLEEEGYNVIIINFDEPFRGEGWNPLAVPYYYWKKAIEEAVEVNKLRKEKGQSLVEPNYSRAIEMILDISNTLAFEEDAKDPYWWQGAASMIATAILLLFENGEDEYVNLSSVKRIYDLGNDSAKGSETTLYKYLKATRDPMSESILRASTYLNAEGVTKSSMQSVFNNKMDLVTATPDIRNMLGNSTFDMEEIFKKKTAVFLLTQDEKATYYPLVAMFFKQLYEVGIKISKENPSRKFDIPMEWIIDEFGTLPEIKDIENIYAAARSRGLKLNIFFQSLSQLRSKYEEDDAKTILDNSDNQIYLGSGTDEVKEYFSKRVGKEKYYNKDTGKHEERGVLTDTQLNQFEKGRSLLTSIEWGSYIIKAPPFSDYIFVRPEVEEVPVIEKPTIQVFDILKAFENIPASESLKEAGVNNKTFRPGEELGLVRSGIHEE